VYASRVDPSVLTFLLSLPHNHLRSKKNENSKCLTLPFFGEGRYSDDASHCAKILPVFYDKLDISDPNDPDVIIKIDMSNAFNTTCRALTPLNYDTQ
jgi:hypothetical protein